MMKKSNKKGFTLVELIVVIAIMAILAAVLVPTVTSKIGQANESSANSTASAIANSVRTDIISIQSGIFTSLDVLEETTETTNIITINGKNFKAQADVGAGTKGTTEVTVAVGTGTTVGTVTVATTVSGRRATYTVTLATNGAITVSEPTYDKV